ncbi:AMP-binding protein [Streptomyces sp. FH025]|uniref:AMP-binding protein n=1 Tax=Streptomyces sp. FH025 TaxID=2815937 RepID=UPI001A9DCF74|nr:AMP-binding protein [Streptomyces sp. FH025]MBO1413569.1 AMP-binding protein [Streptomyces sp. FH025]
MTSDRQPGTAHDRLEHHARHRPDAVALTCLDGDRVRKLTFRQLSVLVASAGEGLLAAGARPGDRVVMVLPNDESFVAVLLAAMARGIVPVPAATPATTRSEAFGRRLRGIAADCLPALVVTTAPWRDAVRTALGGLDAPGGVRTWPDLAEEGATGLPPYAPAPDAPAFLQYTSGSTGSPKGAVISHRALHAACTQAARVYDEGPDDVAVTWVPLHHDMGLVTGVLRPLFSGYTSVLMPPEAFARRPAAWPAAVTAHGGTLSSAPDFAYALCARKVTDQELAALDLRTWRVARSAGEVVRAATAERFTARFAAAGFSPRSLCPSYGMAEATLTVTTSTPGGPPVRLAVRTDALGEGRVVPAAPGEPATVLLSSGTPLPGTEVRVRDTSTGRADGPRVGDIAVRGPQLFSGYWPEAHRPAGWHATGDRGFTHGGHLFVIGRTDDVLVHHGRNFYPADVLAACEDVPGLRPGRCAAFSLGDGDSGSRICLVAELADGPGTPPAAQVAAQARRRLASAVDLYVSEVVLLPRGGLPVTTSGKVRVGETRRRLLRGTLPRL